MNVGILTHYNVNNQGAQLQMYALYNTVKEMGHDPVILTYNKNFDFVDEGIQKRNIITIKSIPYILKEFLFKKGIKLTYFNYLKYNKNKKFRMQNFKYKKYSDANVDYAVVGSDEVFSIETGINIMMYGHAVDTKNMISYAPSFGQTNLEKINNHHVANLLASGLCKFKSLSSRDLNTMSVIKELTGRESTLVVDPVLLYDFSKTSTMIKKIKEKYIIVYAYDKNMTDTKEVEAIKKYAKEKGLITVSIGTYHKWCDKNITCNALEWLEYFKNAEEVITDTFHGTILSVINNKPLAVFIRNNLNNNKLSFLLEELKISDRRLNDITNEELKKIFASNMDYNLINKNLDNLREISMNYLKESIGD